MLPQGLCPCAQSNKSLDNNPPGRHCEKVNRPLNKWPAGPIDWPSAGQSQRSLMSGASLRKPSPAGSGRRRREPARSDRWRPCEGRNQAFELTSRGGRRITGHLLPCRRRSSCLGQFLVAGQANGAQLWQAHRSAALLSAARRAATCWPRAPPAVPLTTATCWRRNGTRQAVA